MEKDFNDDLKLRIEESLALLGASAIWKKSQGPVLELSVVPGGKAKEAQGMSSVALKLGARSLLGAQLGKAQERASSRPSRPSQPSQPSQPSIGAKAKKKKSPAKSKSVAQPATAKSGKRKP